LILSHALSVTLHTRLGAKEACEFEHGDTVSDRGSVTYVLPNGLALAPRRRRKGLRGW